MTLRLFLVSVLLAFTGCESLSNRVQDRFATVEPKRRVFSASASDTFLGAQAALKRLDFTLTSTAQAQGRIEARSRVMPADSLGGARQYFFELRLSGPAAGPTEVSALLSQSTEGDFRAGPNSVALKDHGLYSSLFAAMQAVLKDGSPAPANR